MTEIDTTCSDFARVGLVSVVAVILGINTLSSLLPASDTKAPSISGPSLYQAAALPIRAEGASAPVTAARPKPAQVTSTAVALLVLPQKWPAADKSTIGLVPLPQPTDTQAAEPVFAEAESPPEPGKRAAGPKRPKKVRFGDGSMLPAPISPKLKQVGTPAPIYTRDVQRSVY